MEIIKIMDDLPLRNPQKIIVSNTFVKCKLIKEKIQNNWYRIDYNDERWGAAKNCITNNNWVNTDYNWIWPTVFAGPGDIALFRRSFFIPDMKDNVYGWIEVAADDFAEVFINNQKLKGSFSFRNTIKINISNYLKFGKNVIAIKVVNSSNSVNNNPAGLYFKVDIFYKSVNHIITDRIVSSNGSLKAYNIGKKDIGTDWISKNYNENNWVEAINCPVNKLWGRLKGGAWKWISADAKGGEQVLFRKQFVIQENSSLLKAFIFILVDDRVELYINGFHVVNYIGFKKPIILDITEYLTYGENILDFKVSNSGEEGEFNPAGLNFLLAISYNNSIIQPTPVYKFINC